MAVQLKWPIIGVIVRI
ncbi:unnamed protein product [Debaryomyces tyrocola]|nr:unnamed protein product [Debaryomyces tyrocola]